MGHLYLVIHTWYLKARSYNLSISALFGALGEVMMKLVKRGIKKSRKELINIVVLHLVVKHN